MALSKVSSLFSKYAHLTPPGHKERQALNKAIKKLLDVDIPISVIKIQNTVAYIRISPIIKQQILKKQTELLGLVNEVCEYSPVTKII